MKHSTNGGRVVVHAADVLVALRAMPDASVDAVVTDPPYGLEFMGKAWDSFKDRDAAQTQTDTWGRADGQTGAYAATMPRYTGKAGASLAPFQAWCEAWAVECLRVLKPGGHLLAFGGTRTWHRLACAVEDAGFEVRDSLAWLYGSGFPKSLDVSKAIDKLDVDSTDWQGWGTALKPGFEPCVVARKPLVGTVARNVLEHGTGALNIDACRIGDDSTIRTQRGATQAWEGGAFSGDRENGSAAGRWPANVLLDEDQAAELDQQTGISSSRRIEKPAAPTPDVRVAYSSMGGARPARGHTDTGGASRFFYVAKAPKSERPVVDGVAHPTVKPLTLMRWLVRLVTPPNGLVLDPFAGSGSTVEACIVEGFRVVAVERDASYLPLIAERIRRAVPADGDA